LPARQFEAGNSGGGRFGCDCGAPIEAAQSDQCLTPGGYKSLSDRARTASTSVTITKRGVLDIENMKVCASLQQRNCYHNTLKRVTCTPVRT
jgi:hypothetical protein